MDKDIATQWVAALRSGEYVRAVGCLRSAEGNHCCLGVLSDLHCKTGGGRWLAVGEGVVQSSGGSVYRSGDSSSSSYLTPAVQLWAGMTKANPQLDAILWSDLTPARLSLSEVNDMAPPEIGFDEIADLIEKNWESL